MAQGKTKILIVDDHPENISSLSHLIAGDGIEVHSASNAEGALDLLTQHEFALALLDVQMPGVSGFELARLVRGVKRFRNLPVIFVTAHQRDQSVIFEGYETGAVDLLFKPLDPHVVRTKVQAFVKLDQQARLLQAQVAELERLRMEAESANVAKGRFLANMSHEIRTPLAAVLGFAEVLSQGEVSGEKRGECMSAIKRNGDLLLRLIDDILDFSKIEAQGVTLEKTEFSLQDLLSDVESTLSFKAAEKGLGLRFELVSGLSTRYVSDPTRIKQVLLNVIGNAVKFTERGNIHVSLRSDAYPDGRERLSFTVRDEGIGLTPEQAARLFQPFSQADASTRRHFGGTGLGLVISREIARLLGGELTLAGTKPGVGTTFEITFLVTPALAHDVVSARKVAPLGTRTPGPSLNDRLVLAVDDSIDNLTLIELFLKPTGVQLRTATSGTDAIARVREQKPDLILMDVQMPGMDGLEATRQIRTEGYDGFVIGHTAHAMREEHEKCLQAGYDFVLTKPIDRQKLVAQVELALRSPRPKEPGVSPKAEAPAASSKPARPATGRA